MAMLPLLHGTDHVISAPSLALGKAMNDCEKAAKAGKPPAFAGGFRFCYPQKGTLPNKRCKGRGYRYREVRRFRRRKYEGYFCHIGTVCLCLFFDCLSASDDPGETKTFDFRIRFPG